MADDDAYSYLERLILAGAVEVSGIAESGEFTYSFTQKIDELDAELKQRMDDIFLGECQKLWELGFINMNISEKNPVVSITSLALDEPAVARLSPALQETLEYIMKVLKL